MAVDPDKDVDGFHPVNVGKMALDLPSFLPATPYGILNYLKGMKWKLQEKMLLLLVEAILLEDL